MEWVTAPAILAQAGAETNAANTEWAEACAAAVSAGFDARLDGTLWALPPIEPPEPLPAELTWAALTCGVEAYKRREAVFGITGYVDLQGAAIRIARDYLEAVAPVFERYATRGIA